MASCKQTNTSNTKSDTEPTFQINIYYYYYYLFIAFATQSSL